MLRRFVATATAIVATMVAFLVLVPVAAHAEGDAPPLKQGHFSFEGPFGTYDRATLQHGLYVYHEVCSNCHGLYELSYRNLKVLGYTDLQIKAYASQYLVTDGPNDQGDMFQRAGLPSDKFVRPFPNEKAARAANNGAYPPDLALIVKAREGGPAYVYSLLQGFRDPPPGVKVPNGMYYNLYFPGHNISMPPPLMDATVTFPDGAPNDIADEAKDIVTFLEWAADPNLEERHRMGVRVMAFLVILSIVLYATKRKIWADVH